MGEPAEMSEAERAQAKAAAHAIIEGVIDDMCEPREALARCAERFKVPRDTLLLWIATVALEARQ